MLKEQKILIGAIAFVALLVLVIRIPAMIKSDDNTGRYVLQNDWLFVSGEYGCLDVIKVDPTGQRKFSENLLATSLRFELGGQKREDLLGTFGSNDEDSREADVATDAKANMRWSLKEGRLSISGLERNGILDVSLKDNRLAMSLRFRSGYTGQVRLVIPFPMKYPGYLDWKTGRYSPSPVLAGIYSAADLETVRVPFYKFVASTGDIMRVEELMRCTKPPRDMNMNGNKKLLAGATEGYDVLFDMPGANVKFEPWPEMLELSSVSSDVSEVRFSMTVLEKSEDTVIPGDLFKPLEFEFSDDYVITNVFGGEYSFNELLNDLWHQSSFWMASGGMGGVWLHWAMQSFGYIDGLARGNSKHNLENWKVGEDPYGYYGHAYVWGDSMHWPFGHKEDSRHLDTNAIMIQAADWYYAWTYDGSFLTKMMPKLRDVMNYQQIYLNGERDKILVLDDTYGDKYHLGLPQESGGTNYYDILPFGYKDGFVNVEYVNSLRAMSRLELAAGNVKESEYYEQLYEEAVEKFRETFWTDSGYMDGMGRFVGAIDVEGNVWDYGFTYLNIRALAYGLGTMEQANKIYYWLEKGKSYSDTGEWKQDIYDRFGFAARFNTIFNDEWWAVGQDVFPWDEQIQNGGADLFESGYDLMARARYFGPDKVLSRLEGIIKRYAEPDRLTGGTPLIFGELVQGGMPGGGAVGVMYSEFPETALLGASMVYGFLNLNPGVRGLELTPQVPSSHKSIRIDNIDYRGLLLSITASRNDTLLLEKNEIDVSYDIRNGNNNQIELTVDDVFNAIRVKSKSDSLVREGLLLTLKTSNGDTLTSKLCTDFNDLGNGYIYFTKLSAGDYVLDIQPASVLSNRGDELDHMGTVDVAVVQVGIDLLVNATEKNKDRYWKIQDLDVRTYSGKTVSKNLKLLQGDQVLVKLDATE